MEATIVLLACKRRAWDLAYQVDSPQLGEQGMKRIFKNHPFRTVSELTPILTLFSRSFASSGTVMFSDFQLSEIKRR